MVHTSLSVFVQAELQLKSITQCFTVTSSLPSIPIAGFLELLLEVPNFPLYLVFLPRSLKSIVQSLFDFRFSPSIFYSVSSPIRFHTLPINPGGTFPVPLSIFHTSVSRSRAPLCLNRLVTIHADSSNPWNYQEFQGSGKIPRLEETVKSRFDFERFLKYKNTHMESHDRPPCRLLTSAI